MDWIIDGLRTVSGAMDYGLLWLAKMVYGVFEAICGVDLLGDNLLQDFTNRIYIMLGVFMVLKLTLSLFKYLIDPDSFSDKSVGFGSLIKNVVLSLVLIVTVPFIYEQAMNLQRMILEKNVIGNFILGTANSASDKDAAGDSVIFSVYSAFFSIRTDLATDPKCAKGMYETYTKTEADGTEVTKIRVTNDCKTELENSAENREDVTTYISAYETGGFDGVKMMIFGSGNGVPLNAKIKGNTNYTYLFSYTWGVSWLAAAFLIYIFTMFCIDVGIRVVKLSFLVIIAPLPILSLIDPSKKNGSFNNWTKMCLYTYLDVFIRYASISFVVFVISRMPVIITNMLSQSQSVSTGIAMLFVVFGALLFAKELPKVIQELIPGMKEFGGGGFKNSLKKLGEAGNMVPGLGRLGRGVGAAGAAATGAFLANKWDRDNGRKIAREQRKLDKQRGVSKAERDANYKRRMAELKQDHKLFDGVGTAAREAGASETSKYGMFGQEKKGSLAKMKAEKAKATSEQLKNMRESYKKEVKGSQVFEAGQSAAKAGEISYKAKYAGVDQKEIKVNDAEVAEFQKKMVAEANVKVANAEAALTAARAGNGDVQAAEKALATAQAEAAAAKGMTKAQAKEEVKNQKVEAAYTEAKARNAETAMAADTEFMTKVQAVEADVSKTQEQRAAEIKKMKDEYKAAKIAAIEKTEAVQIKRASLEAEYGETMYTKAYAEQIVKTKDAKDVRDIATGNYEQAKMAVANGSLVVSGVEYATQAEAIAAVDKLRINALKASGDYDQVKADLDSMATDYSADAAKYKIYEQSKDSREKTERAASGSLIGRKVEDSSSLGSRTVVTKVEKTVENTETVATQTTQGPNATSQPKAVPTATIQTEPGTGKKPVIGIDTLVDKKDENK